MSKPEGEGAAPTDWPAWAEAELKDVAAYDYSLGLTGSDSRAAPTGL